jgi:hypothetical protein
LNLSIEANPYYIKVNAQLIKGKFEKLQMLLKKFKYAFAWTDKDLKSMLP